MAKAVFEGFILSVNKTEGAQLGAIVQVDFVLMVRTGSRSGSAVRHGRLISCRTLLSGWRSAIM